MSEHKEPIPSMIYNASVGGHVTSSQQIIDETENKEQSQINAEVKQNLGQGGSVDFRINQAKNDIIGGASSNGNTLKKIEDRVSPLESAVGTGGSVDSRIASAVATETSRAQAEEGALQQLYENLTQSDIVVTEDHTQVASPSANIIYRELGTTSYSDWMYYNNAWKKMATYDNAIDDEPTAGSDNLVKSGGVYNSLAQLNERIEAIVEGNGDIVIESSIDSSRKTIYTKTDTDFGKDICFILNNKTCTFAENNGINISIYLSDNSTQYRTISKVNEPILYNTSDDVYITGINIMVAENAVSVAGSIELEILYKNSYVTKVSVPENTDNINKIREETDIKGRDVVRNDLAQDNSNQNIKTIYKNFGKNVAMRIIYNDSIVMEGTKIRAYIYSSEPTKSIDIPFDGSWVSWSTNSNINLIYFLTSGGVSKAGAIAIEVAYDDFYSYVLSIHEIDFGTITCVKNVFVTKKLNTPILFNNVSNVELVISNLIYESGNSHPFIYVYALYSENASDAEYLVPITDTINSIRVSAYGYDKLYGVMFISASDFEISFDLKMQISDSKQSIPALAPYETFINVPSYYDDYIKGRQRLIRNLLNDTIINGDAFFFITDTHWEYNAKNSPGVIRKLNEKLSIPRLFHGGDVYHSSIERDGYSVDLINALRTAINSDKVYVTDGNHEFTNTLGTYGDVFAESRIYLDDVVYGGENKNYYYVDNKQKKIRYINLYSFGEYVNGSITVGFEDTEQLNWFKDVALNVETGWCIIIFTHTLSYVDPYDNIVRESYMGAYDLYNIIDSYQGNGTIIGCITGHTHFDCVVQNKCSCPIICTTSDMNFPFKYGSGEEAQYDFDFLFETRECGTINEQAFDVVIFDRNKMLLNFVRIGGRAMNLSNSHAEDAQVDIRTILIDSMSVGDKGTLSSSFNITSWESSDSMVVSVSNGSITANTAGYAVITGTSANNEKQSWFIKVV